MKILSKLFKRGSAEPEAEQAKGKRFLMLMRHGNQMDAELSSRQVQNAIHRLKICLPEDFSVSAFLYSPTERTERTAASFLGDDALCDARSVMEERQWLNETADLSAEQRLNELAMESDDWDTICLVTHGPVAEAMIRHLVPEVDEYTVRMLARDEAGITVLEVPVNFWADMKDGVNCELHSGTSAEVTGFGETLPGQIRRYLADLDQEHKP